MSQKFVTKGKPSYKIFRNECHIGGHVCDKCHTIVYLCYMFQWFVLFRDFDHDVAS